MLRNHLKRVLLGLIVGIIGGLVYCRYTPKIYEADATVFVNSDQKSGSGSQGSDLQTILALGASQNIVSEVSLLKSEGTFQRAMQNVGTKNASMTLLDPEEEQMLFPMYDVLAIMQSRVVTVQVKAHKPVDAADIANEIVSVYNDRRKQAEEDSYSNARTYLADQVTSAQTDLAGIELKLRDYRAKNHIAELATAENQTAAYMASLQEQLNASNAASTSLQMEINKETQEEAATPATATTSVNEQTNPAILDFQQQITKLELQRDDLLKTYQPTSSKVRDVEANLALVRKDLANAEKTHWVQQSKSQNRDPIWQELETTLKHNRALLAGEQSKGRSLAGQLSTQTGIVSKMPETVRVLTSLTRDQEVASQRYQRLKTQLDDMRVKNNSGVVAAELLYKAEPNPTVVAPLPSHVVPIGAVAGTFLFLLISLAIESLRTTVRSSTELTGTLGLPVAATAPQLNARKAQARLLELAGRRFTPFESFRFMASRFALAQGHPQRVLFTSAGGGVGCSSSAGDFAIAASRMGIRTVLIDADLKFATLSRVFDMRDRSGVREILNKQMLPSPDGQIAFATEHERLTIIPAGTTDGDGISDVPLSVLEGLLESLKGTADLIVIDAPPCNVLADAARFVPLVDEVCLVVSAKRTKNDAILEAENLLRRAGAENVSLILTGTTPKEEAFSRENRYRAA